MDELFSEKEQIEAIRTWWQENGRYIVSGVVIGVGLLVGWNYWKDRQEQNELAASALYESLVTTVGEVEVEAAETTAGRIFENHASTVYASQARLAMAKLYMDVGRDQDAADELTALLADGGNSEIQMVARLRLAKILMYQEKPEEAVRLLQGHGDSAFAARCFDALGDAYVLLGKFDDAREAYSAALADNPETPTVNRTLIQMKLNDLPAASAGEAPAADAAPNGQQPADTAAEPDEGEGTAEPQE